MYITSLHRYLNINSDYNLQIAMIWLLILIEVTLRPFVPEYVNQYLAMLLQ